MKGKVKSGCPHCGSELAFRKRTGECMACDAHTEAERDLQAARYISKMKVRDPDGKIMPLLERAAKLLRISARNYRDVAILLGAKHRP